MYNQILFCAEFGKGTYVAEKKIIEIRDKFQSKLSLIHIVEMPTVDPFPEIINKEPLFVKQAQNQLADVGKALNVPIEDQYVEVGDPKVIIPDYIEKHSIDLLIVGHHERHGIYRILGSTAYALIAHTKCDVLIIPYPSY